MAKIDRERLITLAQELVRRASVTGTEQQMAEYVKERMLELGFDEAVIDKAGNVVGKICGQGRYKILFDAHIDTVDIGDGDKWTHPPFAAEVQDGVLYGRGIADMKGALAAMLEAGAALATEKGKLPGDIYISGTVSEEIAEGRSFEVVLDAVAPDYVIIGEASELNVKVGQRGRAEVLLEAHGKSAHSSTPELAVNAAEKLADAIAALRTVSLPDRPLLGKAIMALTDMISEPYPGLSVIPFLAKATYDRRTLTGERVQDVLGPVQAVLDRCKEEDPDFDVTVSLAENQVTTYTGYTFTNQKFFPAWELDVSHPLAKGTIQAVETTGLRPAVTAYRFCTNGSSSAGKRGIPTVGFGPGGENMAHTVDEHVPCADLEKAAQGYMAIMQHDFKAN